MITLPVLVAVCTGAAVLALLTGGAGARLERVLGTARSPGEDDAAGRGRGARGPGRGGGRAGGPGSPGHPVSAPLVLELLAVALHGGTGLPGALDAVGDAVGGPVGTALVRAAALLGLGSSWSDAWAGALATVGTGTTGAGASGPGLAGRGGPGRAGPGGAGPGRAASRRAAEAVRCVERELGFAVESGAALGDVLVGRAESLRSERRRDLERAAGSLGVRLVFPLGLCFLPAFGLLGVVPVVVSLLRGLLG